MFDVDYETIEIGDAEDDGTGNTRRRGFEFVNSNATKTLSNMTILNDNINSIRTSVTSLDSETENLPSFPAHSSGVVVDLSVDPGGPRLRRGRAVGMNGDGLAVGVTSITGVSESPIIGLAEADGTIGVGGMVRVRVSGSTTYGIAAAGQRIYISPLFSLPSNIIGITTTQPSAIYIGRTNGFRVLVNVIINPS